MIESLSKNNCRTCTHLFLNILLYKISVHFVLAKHILYVFFPYCSLQNAFVLLKVTLAFLLICTKNICAANKTFPSLGYDWTVMVLKAFANLELNENLSFSLSFHSQS